MHPENSRYPEIRWRREHLYIVNAKVATGFDGLCEWMRGYLASAGPFTQGRKVLDSHRERLNEGASEFTMTGR